MKRNLIITAVVVTLVFASALFVNAMTSTLLKVNIPFEFQVGQTSLPAGLYTFEIQRASTSSALGSALAIRTWDGKGRQVISTRTTHGAVSQATLTFNKYANTYFLAAVDAYGLGCELNKSKTEKEIAGKAKGLETISVAAVE